MNQLLVSTDIFLTFSIALGLKRNTIQYSIIKNIRENIFKFPLEFTDPSLEQNKLVKQMSPNDSPPFIQMMRGFFLF